MPRLRVHELAISLGGFAAGPDQSPDAPRGAAGEGVEPAGPRSVTYARPARPRR